MSGLDEAREAMCIIALRLVREARLPFSVTRSYAGIVLGAPGGHVGIVSERGGGFRVTTAGESVQADGFDEALSAAVGMCAAQALVAAARDVLEAQALVAAARDVLEAQGPVSRCEATDIAHISNRRERERDRRRAETAS